jgi:hypothetical protein
LILRVDVLIAHDLYGGGIRPVCRSHAGDCGHISVSGQNALIISVRAFALTIRKVTRFFAFLASRKFP